MRLIYISLLLFVLPATAAAAPLTIYAAASTIGAMEPLEKLWSHAHSRKLRVVYGSSGALARQISLGAPAHVYFSANPRWIDYLTDKKQLRAESRKTVLKNSLALIASAGAKRTPIVDLGDDILRLLGSGSRLALGDPRHVPAGRYAREALTSLGIWNALAPRSARTRNVRLALALVQRGETPLGIVYRTDARNDETVRVLATFPADLHSPIVYQAAATATHHPDTDAFLAFLTSSRAAQLYRDAGFGLPE